MPTQRIRDILQNGQPNDAVTVQGWVRTKRELKKFTFMEVNDGSSMTSIQVVIDVTMVNHENVLRCLNTGASVEVIGTLLLSPGEGQRVEVKASSVRVYGESDPKTYPLQKKRHSFEFLRTIGHLRARTNTIGAVMRVRNACSSAIHRFFQERNFIWVHTPIITPSDCEGAGELFTVTNLDLNKVLKNEEKSIDYSQDFFGKRAYLTVSGQLEAEVMAMAFKSVYTFGPTFRAENSNTSRHLAEFWMVEPEMAFCDLEDNQDLAEAFLKYIFKSVLETCPEDIEFFDKLIDKTVLETANNIIDNDFERITYTEAIKLLERAKQKFEYPVEWGINLQSEHEQYLAEKLFKKPLIVTNYPEKIKAFYMRLNDDGKTVAAMDVLAPKIGEIIGGSQREERLDMLQKRTSELGILEKEIWWYLDLHRYGTVPHSGFGLGFERLVQFMTGMGNIRDVIPFPRTPLSAEF
ncbi:asparagine--tRNA ligase [cyanobacterium endosymbiont of Epithemia turgida]|uniref:asparagine--tRNA ligase n=1 Tax=cyanobacterium endosymbiont of Epithemia turgida TaxID=718217 RepID=UPI0004D15CF6|nr:asparagine--tRNA ligase [cyanobacterium endosymbiont of Epithemia turgida]BAP17695.1 asparaginyl-tRNA synthetase [cyanobacterium endosymbiont of Epithemia turgida isolate EtSB Lake Yunoko]